MALAKDGDILESAKSVGLDPSAARSQSWLLQEEHAGIYLCSLISAMCLIVCRATTSGESWLVAGDFLVESWIDTRHGCSRHVIWLSSSVIRWGTQEALK